MYTAAGADAKVLGQAAAIFLHHLIHMIGALQVRSGQQLIALEELTWNCSFAKYMLLLLEWWLKHWSAKLEG